MSLSWMPGQEPMRRSMPYDYSPICAADNHECDSVSPCAACDGEVYCDNHMNQCDGCKKVFCLDKHPLTQTNCGLMCEDCIEEFAAKVQFPASVRYL